MLDKLLSKLNRLRIVVVPLGRWCRTEKRVNDIKVDMANTDHCGTCVYEKIKDIPVIKSITSTRQSATVKTK
jgi:hypothetical protein